MNAHRISPSPGGKGVSINDASGKTGPTWQLSRIWSLILSVMLLLLITNIDATAQASPSSGPSLVHTASPSMRPSRAPIVKDTDGPTIPEGNGTESNFTMGPTMPPSGYTITAGIALNVSNCSVTPLPLTAYLFEGQCISRPENSTVVGYVWNQHVPFSSVWIQCLNPGTPFAVLFTGVNCTGGYTVINMTQPQCAEELHTDGVNTTNQLYCGAYSGFSTRAPTTESPSFMSNFTAGPTIPEGNGTESNFTMGPTMPPSGYTITAGIALNVSNCSVTPLPLTAYLFEGQCISRPENSTVVGYVWNQHVPFSSVWIQCSNPGTPFAVLFTGVNCTGGYTVINMAQPQCAEELHTDGVNTTNQLYCGAYSGFSTRAPTTESPSFMSNFTAGPTIPKGNGTESNFTMGPTMPPTGYTITAGIALNVSNCSVTPLPLTAYLFEGQCISRPENSTVVGYVWNRHVPFSSVWIQCSNPGTPFAVLFTGVNCTGGYTVINMTQPQCAEELHTDGVNTTNQLYCGAYTGFSTHAPTTESPSFMSNFTAGPTIPKGNGTESNFTMGPTMPPSGSTITAGIALNVSNCSVTPLPLTAYLFEGQCISRPENSTVVGYVWNQHVPFSSVWIQCLNPGTPFAVLFTGVNCTGGYTVINMTQPQCAEELHTDGVNTTNQLYCGAYTGFSTHAPTTESPSFMSNFTAGPTIPEGNGTESNFTMGPTMPPSGYTITAGIALNVSNCSVTPLPLTAYLFEGQCISRPENSTVVGYVWNRHVPFSSVWIQCSNPGTPFAVLFTGVNCTGGYTVINMTQPQCAEELHTDGVNTTNQLYCGAYTGFSTHAPTTESPSFMSNFTAGPTIPKGNGTESNFTMGPTMPPTGYTITAGLALNVSNCSVTPLPLTAYLFEGQCISRPENSTVVGYVWNQHVPFSSVWIQCSNPGTPFAVLFTGVNCTGGYTVINMTQPQCAEELHTDGVNTTNQLYCGAYTGFSTHAPTTESPSFMSNFTAGPTIPEGNGTESNFTMGPTMPPTGYTITAGLALNVSNCSVTPLPLTTYVFEGQCLSRQENSSITGYVWNQHVPFSSVWIQCSNPGTPFAVLFTGVNCTGGYTVINMTQPQCAEELHTDGVNTTNQLYCGAYTGFSTHAPTTESPSFMSNFTAGPTIPEGNGTESNFTMGPTMPPTGYTITAGLALNVSNCSVTPLPLTTYVFEGQCLSRQENSSITGYVWNQHVPFSSVWIQCSNPGTPFAVLFTGVNCTGGYTVINMTQPQCAEELHTDGVNTTNQLYCGAYTGFSTHAPTTESPSFMSNFTAGPTIPEGNGTESNFTMGPTMPPTGYTITAGIALNVSNCSVTPLPLTAYLFEGQCISRPENSTVVGYVWNRHVPFSSVWIQCLNPGTPFAVLFTGVNCTGGYTVINMAQPQCAEELHTDGVNTTNQLYCGAYTGFSTHAPTTESPSFMSNFTAGPTIPEGNGTESNFTMGPTMPPTGYTITAGLALNVSNCSVTPLPLTTYVFEGQCLSRQENSSITGYVWNRHVPFSSAWIQCLNPGTPFAVLFTGVNCTGGYTVINMTQPQCAEELHTDGVNTTNQLYCAAYSGFTTHSPTLEESISPSTSPGTSIPTSVPSHIPTSSIPTSSPSRNPLISVPTNSPASSIPTRSPSRNPSTSVPTNGLETSTPSVAPSLAPSISVPTNSPASSIPTRSPSRNPSTTVPTNSLTTSMPSVSPSLAPSTSVPTNSPASSIPTRSPSRNPSTSVPTNSLTTSIPSVAPSPAPSTSVPTNILTTSMPSGAPSLTPSKSVPTNSPTISMPTVAPSLAPSSSPVIPGGNETDNGTESPTFFSNFTAGPTIPEGNGTESNFTIGPTMPPSGYTITAGLALNVSNCSVTPLPLTTYVFEGQCLSRQENSSITGYVWNRHVPFSSVWIQCLNPGTPFAVLFTGVNCTGGYTVINMAQPQCAEELHTDGVNTTNQLYCGAYSGFTTHAPTTESPSFMSNFTAGPTIPEGNGTESNFTMGPTMSNPTLQPTAYTITAGLALNVSNCSVTPLPLTTYVFEGQCLSRQENSSITGYVWNRHVPFSSAWIQCLNPGTPFAVLFTGVNCTGGYTVINMTQPQCAEELHTDGVNTTNQLYCGAYSGFSTHSPTLEESISPSTSPGASNPTFVPSRIPTSSIPTSSPSRNPSISVPANSPASSIPTRSPSRNPSTSVPTNSLTTFMPSVAPSVAPSMSTPTLSPSRSPSTSIPSRSPSTSTPSKSPSRGPTTSTPTLSPSLAPTVSAPTFSPSVTPSNAPTNRPSHSPTSSPSRHPTVGPSTSPSISPSAHPSHAPTGSPTGRTPELSSATLTRDLTRIEVEFDWVTNQRNQPQRGLCSPWLRLDSNDTGCGGSACPVFCTWISPRKLSVELNAQSNFNSLTPWFITISSDSFIRNPFAVSGTAAGTVQVSLPSDLQVPSVVVSGPSVVSLCGSSNVTLQASVMGTGGRVPLVEWFADNVPIGTSPRLIYSKPTQDSVVVFKASSTSFAGTTGTSAEFSLRFSSDAAAQVLLTAPSSFDIDSTGSIDVGTVVNLPVACIPSGFSLANASYKFSWKVSSLTTSQNISLPVSSTNRSRLFLSPASLLPPGDTYRIEVEVDPRIVRVLPGRAFTVVTVRAVPIVAVLSVPTLFSVERLQNTVLSASQSCDPNRVFPPCRLGSGQNANNFTGLQFSWTCRDALGNNCDSVCVTGTSPWRCLIMNNTLSFKNSPYIFVANVSSSSPGTPSSLTPNVTVNVLSDPPPLCIRPRITMAAFPSKINVGQSGEAQLRSTISSDFVPNVTAGRTLDWFVISKDTGLVTSPSSLVQPGMSLNSPNLVLLLSKLIPGSEYVFRLVASIPCTSGNDAFGEISFVTNTPPTGGVLTVFPLIGDAGLSDFSLIVDGASDEDLPLQYSFEYRTVFGPSEVDSNNNNNGSTSASFLTLSAFSQANSLKTRFAKASRILVLARIRDSLGAVTPRSQCPSVDNIEAKELVITVDQIPFEASTELETLLGSGGSGEDALRVATALAAASSSSSSASTNDSAEIVQWKQRTQSTLLDLVVSTEPAEAADPSFVMLQTSALSSVLLSAESTQHGDTPEGQAFLTKAAGFVGSLLDSAIHAILTKGSGRDDPLLSQHRPSDLGTVTLNSLQSILTAIQSSSLNAGRRRRLSQQESLALRGDDSFSRQLQMSDSGGSEVVIHSVRDQLKKLADVMLLGAVSGSPPQTIQGAEMRVVTVAEIPNKIGTAASAGTKTISIPAFNESDPPTIFTLPENVLEGLISDEEEVLVNILAVRFRFNIRELAGGVLPPNYEQDENAPVNNITEILALDFLKPNGSSSSLTLHPVNLLGDGIQLRIPLVYEPIPNNTKLSCGFFNESLSTWSSSGCNVTEVSLPTSVEDATGYMICSCNHASDYSAWMAFVKDVNGVFDPVDTSNLTTIAAVILGVLLPVLALMWIASQHLARYMDKKDSDHVHYGAFVAMTKRKLELHERQRRFFRILRENREGPVPKADLQRYKTMADTLEAKEEVAKTLRASRELSKRLLGLVTMGVWACFGLMFSGSFVSFFYNSNEASLAILSTMEASLGLTLASGSLSLLIGCVLLYVMVFQGGEISPGVTINKRYLLILMGITVNGGLSVAAAALPSSQMGDEDAGGYGVGWILVMVACGIALVSFLVAWMGFFLHQFGGNTKAIGMEFMVNIAKGMMYEQTLLSAFSRFDPYYDRSKRFSIVLAVIIGNLFACSVFFALRNGEDVSFGLVFASTLISSLIVAIPVKVALRVLFKITKTRNGSKLNRIAHIFRITAFTYDVHPSFASEAERLDVEMLAAFRRFYLAKQNVTILKRLLAQKLQDKSSPLDPTRAPAAQAQTRWFTRLKQFFGRCLCGGDDDDEDDDDNNEGTGGDKQGGGPDAESQTIHKTWDARTGQFGFADVDVTRSNRFVMDIRDLTPQQITYGTLEEGRMQFRQARKLLKRSVESAQTAWQGQEQRFSYVSRKQVLVLREKNAFLRWALIFAEEPNVHPKTNESLLDHRWSILGWTVLLAYYVGCLLWICFWIFSRNAQSEQALLEQGIENPTNAEIAAQTNAYLLAWLGTSFFGVFLGYFVFEPALVVLRFAVLPMCIKALRPDNPSVLLVSAVDNPHTVPSTNQTLVVRTPDHDEDVEGKTPHPALLMKAEDDDEGAHEESQGGRGGRSRFGCCCCCSSRKMAQLEKRMVDFTVTLIEALT